MDAVEFVNEKLGDKNYTHSAYPILRNEMSEWLDEYYAMKLNEETRKDEVVVCQCKPARYGYELHNNQCATCKLPLK